MVKILLVEDDQMIAEIYLRKFQEAGFEVDNAKTGKEVLAMAKNTSYDLVLLDMVLPEMTGMEVLKELRFNPEYDKNLRIVIFSNLSRMEVQSETVENGADGFIGKSEFSPSQVVQEVKRLLKVFSEQNKNAKRLSGGVKKNGKKILFIEDEKLFLEMFGKKLEDSGYEVEYAKNGAWGLKEAAKYDYDAIITDIKMPAMSGEEIIQKLRKNDKTKKVPIIVISASVTDEELMGLAKYNITDFFIKTKIVPSDLSRRLEELFETGI